jgi:hypothetical protein
MKYPVPLTLLMIVLCLKAPAQAYVPIPDSNSVWMQGTGLYNAYPGHQLAACDGPLSFGTDTVINSRAYHRLYGQQVCNWLNTYLTPPPPGTIISGTDYYPVSLRVLFRQDTAQRKVYMYDMFSHRDTLLYDYNLVVGQPYPPTFAAQSSLNLTVTSQYTIALGGNPHRVWVLNNGTVDVVNLIEGVGTSQGFGTQFLIPGFESENFLHCFTRNGNVLLSNWGAGQYRSVTFPSVGICDVTLNTKNLKKDNDRLVLFPNPAEKAISIQSSNPVVAYRVFDLTGRELLAEKVNAANSFEIDLTTLQSGVYLITVQDKQGYAITRSVIKQ